MKHHAFKDHCALVAGLSLAALTVMAGTASAMPVETASEAADAPRYIQQASQGQHRIYPGSESAAAQKARDERNAPNLFCEKQETRCE